MKTYSFDLDKKVTVWIRTSFTVEANNIAEANEKAITALKNKLLNQLSWEEIADTQERMSVKDNKGEPTQEIFRKDKGRITSIFTNKINTSPTIIDLDKALNGTNHE